MKILKITNYLSIIDHHEIVGQVEHCNDFMEQYLRLYSKSILYLKFKYL